MADRVRYVNTASSGGDGTTNGESGGTAAFASLSAAEAAIQTEDSDLANGKVTIYCGVGSGSAADTTTVTVAGFSNASSSNYITIQANPTDTGGDQRAVLPWSTSIYRLDMLYTSTGAQSMCVASTAYTRWINLQIGSRNTSTGGAVTNINANAAGNQLFDSCLLRVQYDNASNSTTSSSTCLLLGANSEARNVVAYSENLQAGQHNGFIGFSTIQSGALYQNCTARMYGGRTFQAAFNEGATPNPTANNCLGDTDGLATTDICFASYSGDYNASSDATAPGGNSLTSVTFKFADASNGDYRLRNGSPGVQAGTDLSGSGVSDDFNGVDRTAQTTYDIGATQITDALVGKVYVNTASSGGNGMSNAESGTDAAYASLSAAEAGEQADLTQFGQPLYVLCGVGSGSAADTTAVTVAGWTVDSGDYLVIQANDSDTGGDQRAVMPWSTSIYRLEGNRNGDGMLTVDEAYTRALNLQIGQKVTSTVGGTRRALFIGGGASATNCLVDSCHCRGVYENAVDASSSGGLGDFYVIQTNSTNAASCDIRNTVVSTENANAGKFNDAYAFIFGGTNTTTVSNCTAYMAATTGVTAGYWGDASTGAIVKNSLADIQAGGGTLNAFRSGATWGAGTDYNASDDATAPGGNSITSATFTFVDAANGDYHIGDGDSSGIKTGGDDLSGTFTVDFDNVTRVDWSIGAVEYVAAAAGGIHELTQTISVSTFSVGLIIVQPVDTDS